MSNWPNVYGRNVPGMDDEAVAALSGSLLEAIKAIKAKGERVAGAFFYARTFEGFRDKRPFLLYHLYGVRG